MKFNKVVVYLIMIINNHLEAQNFSFFDSVNIRPVSTIDWQKIDSQETSPFEEILDTCDLLTLAEGNHKEGASYEAQCMIVKRLIDNKVINKVYTESSWSNIEKINSLLKKYGIDSIQETKKYMNSLELFYWTKNGFWEYLANKIVKNEVHLVGIDLDISNILIQELLIEWAEKDSANFYQKEYSEVIADLKQISNSAYDVDYSYDLYKKSKIFVNKIIDFYKSENSSYKIKQWQIISSFLYWRYYRNFDLNGNRVMTPFDDGKKQTYFHSIRDSIMCDIFVENWSEANSKAVLLIAAYHAMRNSNFIENLDKRIKYNYVNTFGEMLDRKSKLKVYNLSFITSSGRRGVVPFEKKKKKVMAPPKNSIEEYLAKKPYPYLFVDFSGLGDNSFHMNPLSIEYLKAKWGKVFSGVFFIKTMYPLQFPSGEL